MFDTLLVSPAIGAPWTRAVSVALIFHILLITAAVSRTASPPPGPRPVARDTIRLELVEVSSSPHRAEARPIGTEPTVPAPPVVPEIDPDPAEFLRPTFSYRPLGRPQLNPDLLQRMAGGSPDTTRPVSSTTEVDELPELMVQPQPRYPDGLRRVGMSGMVQLQFVVGSNGRVDERSIRVVTSSHPGFMLAALQAVRESRFKPARRGGRPTAVLVAQTIRFSYR